MEKEWRLIFDKKSAGYYNMAADEALVNSYRKNRVPVFRVYGWSRPFVTLGYRQSCDGVLREHSGVDFTRRITGGSAILHNDEITYSLVCSKKDLDLQGSVKESYKKLSSFLIKFYFSMGLNADFAGELPGCNVSMCEDICFLTNEYYDIVINNKKIGGNAQKRLGDIIFQHGSIPLTLDNKVFDSVFLTDASLPLRPLSLFELVDKKSYVAIAKRLCLDFQNTFNINFKSSKFSVDEKSDCCELLKQKYLSDAWNFKK